jgi:DNA-binding MarR family transcriptional regulator
MEQQACAATARTEVGGVMRGHLSRAPAENDRRQLIIALTGRGQAAAVCSGKRVRKSALNSRPGLPRTMYARLIERSER